MCHSILKQTKGDFEAKVEGAVCCHAREESEVKDVGAETVARLGVDAEGADGEQVEIDSLCANHSGDARNAGE